MLGEQRGIGREREQDLLPLGGDVACFGRRGLHIMSMHAPAKAMARRSLAPRHYRADSGYLCARS
ncbi:hypothetical protein GCM10010170_084720 [Dactylosporangium salmoneum]|uniref:Uncharacterized protein n=1 Tax=Dactylosporangium salmoneum TaxID=53361 RepID=A0ABP5UER3_9ACTN